MVVEAAAEVKAVEARVPVAMEAVGKEKATEMVVKALAARAAEVMVGAAAAATMAMAVAAEVARAAVVAAEVARRDGGGGDGGGRDGGVWEGGGGERAHNLTMGMTEADATGAGVRAVAEMVEEVRAAEVKVEKAAAAARVAIAAMRQPVASESKYVHHKRSTSTFHCIAKGMSRKAVPLLLLPSIHCCAPFNCHPQQKAPRISGA